MNYINKLKYVSLAVITAMFLMTSCDDDDEMMEEENMQIDFSGVYAQKDQMGRPAVNTVFVSPGSKDKFNVTIPSDQDAQFQTMFETNLKGLSPAFANSGDKNALMQDATAFTTLLATDVLNVSLDGKTTFYDGDPANTLSGRALADDVITVELLLIFGGEDFMENPGLSDDNVDANDKAFLSMFPYLASPW